MSIDKSAPRHKTKSQSRGHGELTKIKVLCSHSTWLQHRLGGRAQRPTRTISTERLVFTSRGPLNTSNRQTTHEVRLSYVDI